MSDWGEYLGEFRELASCLRMPRRPVGTVGANEFYTPVDPFPDITLHPTRQ